MDGQAREPIVSGAHFTFMPSHLDLKILSVSGVCFSS
jgi:hypothetical protein